MAQDRKISQLNPVGTPARTNTLTALDQLGQNVRGLVASWLGLVLDTDLTFSDVTTGDVSTGAHGYAPKAPNDATKYLDGTGHYSAPSGLLGIHSYAPATNTFLSTTSTTLADLDATNMVVTFTAPTSGRVLVRLTAYADLSNSTQQGFWGLREGTSNLAGAGGVVCRDTEGDVFSIAVLLTGLSAGSHTYKWSAGASGGASFRTGAGPGNTGATVSTTAGLPPAVMEVWAA